MTDFYVKTGVPASHSGPAGTSAAMRAEFILIETAMAKLAGYTGNGSKFLRVNAAGTAYEALSVADALAALAPNSAALAAAISDETGSGALVFATSPTLVTPLLGTPTSGVLTNCTGTAAGLTAGNVTTNANLTGHITSVGNAAVLGSFTSAQLATALSDETGSGAAVFATSPTLVTPILGTPTSGNLANCTFPTLNQNTTGSSASCTGNAATATNATNVTGTAVVTGAITSSSPTAGIGYATGAGASVTQSVSKATAVTINSLAGRITTFNDALAADTQVSFLVNNSSMSAHDCVIINQVSSGGTSQKYAVWVEATALGSFYVTIKNTTAGSLSQALIFNFVVVKGVES